MCSGLTPPNPTRHSLSSSSTFPRFVLPRRVTHLLRLSRLRQPTSAYSVRCFRHERRRNQLLVLLCRNQSFPRLTLSLDD
ncbi:Protein of unknown function [Pyronema omphalodes CBS 100304]|uniref:Uncharacterized protein n=1 Tax=Pyronema omphalodes (strain CBS 100304) TaxID=1076935 RepID=U4LJJ9_PYROM|nr:Protein of unknown function [Pyronema omphalodes CBS 100304]